MTIDDGRLGVADRACAPDGAEPAAQSQAEPLVPDADDQDDHYWDYDDEWQECANCGGEGFTYGCSWDWQCDTYDESEGTCLCTRPCDWCHPRKPNPELQQVLASALAEGIETRRAETGTGSVGDESPVGETDAPQGTDIHE